jgi:integrase
VLVEREYCETNPFEKVKKRPTAKKQRQCITPSDAVVIADYLELHNPVLLTIVQLEYFCLIRPAEIARLQIKHLDFKNNVIHIPADIAKKSPGSPSVPLFLMERLKQYSAMNREMYIFGRKFKVCNEKMGHNYVNSHLKIVLELLYKEGLISTIQGITNYSWKDSGISDMLNGNSGLNHNDVMVQARHTDIKTTLLYYHKPATNPKFHNISMGVFA